MLDTHTLGLPPTQDSSHHQDYEPFLVGNPNLNLHLPLASWVGAISNTAPILPRFFSTTTLSVSCPRHLAKFIPLDVATVIPEGWGQALGFRLCAMVNWLVVSTHLKNISQMGNLPQVGMKIKNIWNHHLVKVVAFCWGCDVHSPHPTVKMTGILIS